MYLPKSIKTLVAEQTGYTDQVGCSSSTVVLYESMVLKISPAGDAAVRESAALRWLAGKLPVPAVLGDETANGLHYLLMSRIPGVMSCDAVWMDHPDELLDRLAEGLRLLWAVDTTDCPWVNDLDHALAFLRERVERGELNAAACTPGTFGPGGFRSPADLLGWLERNRPEESFVFSHDDYCMPNIFLDREKNAVAGFIDLGGCGLADRWHDIALCLKSLRRNFSGFFGGPVRPAPDEARFFTALGIGRDEERLRYYLLLDELLSAG